ncbi:MAG TPA: SRPBCC family protein [Gammaproteobacteria bacterium]|nr:SRPBCC family protein [Gammaproteobacteria bacterium]
MTATAQDSSPVGRVGIEGQYASIVFKRLLRHAPELVWEAITDPEELKGWLMCSSARIDGRAGGSIEMISGPAQYHSKGRILAWDPPRLFEYEWKVAAVSEMPMGQDAVFRYELMRQGDSTLLTVTYSRLTQQVANGFAPGAHVLLDRLEAQLGKRALPDWMERYSVVKPLYPEWKA